MGIDFENGRFTPENHELLPQQTEKLIRDLEAGDIAYVEVDDHR